MWIEINERLPDDGVFVSVLDDDGEVLTANYDGDLECFCDGNGTNLVAINGYNITHWMPVLYPPTAKNK